MTKNKVTNKQNAGTLQLSFFIVIWVYKVTITVIFLLFLVFHFFDNTLKEKKLLASPNE